MPLVGRIAAVGPILADQAIEGAPSSTPRTTSSAASTRPASTSRWTSCACPASVAFPPVEGNALTRDDQLAKLRVIAETARDIWGY